MGYHPRIETTLYSSFLTTRSRNSELWFINNKPLEHATLGYLAKFAARYEMRLYAFAIEGNHHQLPAMFPHGRRSDFMRDFNSCIARAVPRYCPSYTGGRFWERRFSLEFLASHADIENWFFYTVLQAVQDGLVEKISQYPGYNCFYDAVHGISRNYKVINWAKYNSDRRRRFVNIRDYTEIVTLAYQRLPGYEHFTQKEYAQLMCKKLEERTQVIVKERRARGLGFVGREKLLKARQGARPKTTKTSAINDHRPRVLSTDPAERAKCKEWYFSIYFKYQECSRKYRAGDWTITFPEGTYRPYCQAHPPSLSP